MEYASAAASERQLARLLFFSDAVFAIVLTLLVLELRPPPGDDDAALFEGLRTLAPHFLAFAVTFALVSVFWVAHMSIMKLLGAFSWTVAVVNLFFLFAIAWTPFASGLLGEHGQRGLAWSIYCVVLMAASVGQALLVIAIAAGPSAMEPRQFWHRFVRALSPGIAFGAGLWLNLSGYEALGAFCWALIPLIFVLAQVALGPRKTKS